MENIMNTLQLAIKKVFTQSVLFVNLLRVELRFSKYLA